jgi:uncharacterized repeat protein (TIGR01451 family)
MKKLYKSFIMAALVLLSAQSAFAAGTAAGTAITNTATANFEIGGTPQDPVESNEVTVTVAELIDSTVTWQDSSNVIVASGDAAQVLTFLLTNTGNGNDSYNLATDSALGGDDFDPTNPTIFLDTNGNGSYDPGVDQPYSSGSPPTLGPDESITVFVLNDIPGALDTGDTGDSMLTATSTTASGHSPGDVISGGGDGGVDAVVGNPGGNATGTYEVGTPAAAAVTMVKTSTVISDPLGGTSLIPGAVIEYSITVTVTGTGTAQNLVITDPIPANTTYNTGTIELDGTGLSDTAGNDAGSFGANTVTVDLGDVAGGSADRVITFRVTID